MWNSLGVELNFLEAGHEAMYGSGMSENIVHGLQLCMLHLTCVHTVSACICFPTHSGRFYDFIFIL